MSVEGKLTYRTYEKDGITRYITEIVAENIEILKSKEKDEHIGGKDEMPF